MRTLITTLIILGGLKAIAQSAPQILLNGALNHPYYVFENHVGGNLCISFSAVSPDTASKDSIELYWNNGLPGSKVWFSLDGHDRYSEYRRLCWTPADTLPVCNLWYFTVYARYKNIPNSPVASRVVPIRLTKPFTAKLHFPQTGPLTYQLVPQTYRTPQGVCSPNDTNIIQYQWAICKNGDGLFTHIGAFYYNSKTAAHTFTQPGNYVVRLRMESDDYCCVDFRFDTINVATMTGKTEIGETVFSLYPNPTKNLLHLQTTAEVQHLEMYDIMGKKVHINYAPSGDEYRIELPELSKGVYLIHLITAQQQRFTQKVCIE
ncbi:MAG: T9SS type A sorting domain-containing protein [Bacteroidia bacterium]